jgi:hypothetical protein
VNTDNQARHESTLGGMEAPRYEFVTSLYVALRPGCFKPRGNNHRYPGDRSSGRSQSQHRELRGEKSLAASGNRTPDSAVVQSTAHSYAEYSRMKTVEWNVPEGECKLGVI